MRKANKLLKKFLNGTASEKEIILVENWLKSVEKENDTWADLNDNEKAEFLIHLKTRVDDTIQMNSNPKKTFLWMWTAAAVILLSVLGIMYFIRGGNERKVGKQITLKKNIRTGIGEVKKIALSDGSCVWLNAKSEISFINGFVSDKRELYLKGEAYFEIKRDVKRPFIVHANSWKVKVLGTHFDVSDYQEDHQTSVSVTEGKVAIETNNNEPLNSILHSGDELSFSKVRNKYYKRQVSTASRPAWINKNVVFYHCKMVDVGHFIKRNFGYNLLFKEPEIKDMELSGEFGNITEVEELLKIICLTLNTEFTINENNIEISMIH